MRLLDIAMAGAVGGFAWGGMAAAPRQERQAAQELTAFETERTRRFLENRAACLGCHEIDGRGGRIGPSLDDLGARVDAEYVRNVIRDPAAAIPGTLMPRQRMPPREVERLTAYLLARPPVSSEVGGVVPQTPPLVSEADRDDGGALYGRHCAACHGVEGAGDGWNAPALPVPPTAHADPALMVERPDDSLFDAIYSGAFVLDGSPLMPAFGEMLSPPQIRALVAHIRVLCDCRQPAWAGGE